MRQQSAADQRQRDIFPAVSQAAAREAERQGREREATAREAGALGAAEPSAFESTGMRTAARLGQAGAEQAARSAAAKAQFEREMADVEGQYGLQKAGIGAEGTVSAAEKRAEAMLQGISDRGAEQERLMRLEQELWPEKHTPTPTAESIPDPMDDPLFRTGDIMMKDISADILGAREEKTQRRDAALRLMAMSEVPGAERIAAILGLEMGGVGGMPSPGAEDPAMRQMVEGLVAKMGGGAPIAGSLHTTPEGKYAIKTTTGATVELESGEDADLLEKVYKVNLLPND
jgi:hypothetical protein